MTLAVQSICLITILEITKIGFINYFLYAVYVRHFYFFATVS